MAYSGNAGMIKYFNTVFHAVTINGDRCFKTSNRMKNYSMQAFIKVVHTTHMTTLLPNLYQQDGEMNQKVIRFIKESYRLICIIQI